MGRGEPIKQGGAQCTFFVGERVSETKSDMS